MSKQIKQVSMKPVESNLLGFGRGVQAAELAIAAGEHLMVMGTAGTAKSLLADQVFANFEGDVFKTQLSKNTDETSIFGVPDMKRLRETGEIHYNPNAPHTIFNSEFAFIDEMFDASDVLLRSLLGVLNEREFVRSNQRIGCRLVTCIATSNYARVNDITHAVIDRFALTVGVTPLSRKERKLLYSSVNDFEDFQPKSRVTLATLAEIRNNVGHSKLPDDLRGVILDYAEKLQFSPRRERKANKLVRTRAVMQGRLEVCEQDLIDVIPLLVPIHAEMDEYQKKVDETRKSIKSALKTAKLLMEQKKLVHGLGDLSGLSGAEKAKKASQDIQQLAGIDPLSEEIALAMKQKEEYLTQSYNEVIEELGLGIPTDAPTADKA